MPDPSSYPDLNALLAAAHASLANANALDATVPQTAPAGAAPVAAPAPVDNSLWGRIKRIGNASPLPADVGDQFTADVDPQAARDHAANSGDGPGWWTTFGKSALANEGGTFLDALRGQATPVGLGTLAAGGEGPLAKIIGGASSAIFGGEGVERAADPNADPTSRVLGGFDALQGLLGLHGALHDLPTPGNRAPASKPLTVERYAPNRSADWSAPTAEGDPHAADLIPPVVDRYAPNRSAADVSPTADPILPSARYAFHQDDFNGGSFPMYHIEGGPLDRSTVSADTLAEHGIAMPDTPAPTPRPAPAAPEADLVDEAPPAAVTPPTSPLQRLFQPYVSATDAARNLSESGSLLGSPHAADEVAGMERDFGAPLPDVAQQLKARRQVDHMEATRNDARYRYLTADDDTPPPTSPAPPPPDTPSSSPNLMDQLKASIAKQAEDRSGHFTLPKPSPAMATRINDLLEARDRALGREPLTGDAGTAAPSASAIDPATPVVDAAGREIAPPQGAEPAPRPDGPWANNGSGEIPAPASPATPPAADDLSEAGFAHAGLAAHLLRPAIGAAAGAYFDDDNPEQGALIGGGLGAASMAPGVTNQLERLRYATMLTGLAPLKKLMADTGVTANVAAERGITHGAGAGLDVLKNFLSPTTAKDFINRVKTNNLDPSVLMDQPTSTSYKGVLGIPSRIMGAATEATQGAMRRAGISAEDANTRTFTAEPQSRAGKAALQFQRSSPVSRLFLPFAKTAINQAEAGTLPIHALGSIGELDPAARKQLLAKVGLLGASGVAGATVGQSDFATDHPTLAKLTTLLAGPGALEYGVVQSFAHALAGGKSHAQALTAAGSELRHQLPAPSEWATSPQELLASFAPSALAAINPDDVPRDTSNNVFGALLKRIPYLSTLLPPKGGAGKTSHPKLLGDED